MCLYKKYKFPRIALTNKKVYKGVTKKILGIGEIYITPFRGIYVKLGEVYKGIFTEGNITSSIFSKIIEDGYIHCYERKIFAKNDWNYDAIIECEIPKWTLYWVGMKGEIATRKLRYLKIV